MRWRRSSSRCSSGGASGRVVGTLGAGVPPIGIAFVDSGGDSAGERIQVAIFVVLLLGGSAWLAGRVRERYGKPPWGHSERVWE